MANNTFIVQNRPDISVESNLFPCEEFRKISLFYIRRNPMQQSVKQESKEYHDQNGDFCLFCPNQPHLFKILSLILWLNKVFFWLIGRIEILHRPKHRLTSY